MLSKIAFSPGEEKIASFNLFGALIELRGLTQLVLEELKHFETLMTYFVKTEKQCVAFDSVHELTVAVCSLALEEDASIFDLFVRFLTRFSGLSSLALNGMKIAEHISLLAPVLATPLKQLSL